MKEKAYKLLAIQEKISNNEAKKLIDDGFVFFQGKKLKVARAEVDQDAKFRVEKPREIKKIFEDKNLLAINKPHGFESYDLEKKLGAKLVHRLDKNTSGILLFAKNDEFLEKATEEFRARRVVKKYLVVVDGIVAEPFTVDLPVFTQKGSKAKSKIDLIKGKEAKTIVTPIKIVGKKSLLEVEIPTGRTHQIRVHLSYANFPILGDELYGGRSYKQMLLHSSYISLLGYELEAETPSEFNLLFSSN